jgi:hypothetical protein
MTRHDLDEPGLTAKLLMGAGVLAAGIGGYVGTDRRTDRPNDRELRQS